MKKDTSWNKSKRWYSSIVGMAGHYYHQHVVLPVAIKMLDLTSHSVLLDVGCGQGILARTINPEVEYVGIDSSKELLKEATSLDRNKRHRFLWGDATKPLAISQAYFTHAAIILALQNIQEPASAFRNVAHALKPGGIVVIVLNHPCFRIPRQSGWIIDEQNKQQKRWVARYMTPMEIPIETHPGKVNSVVTWSFHQPLSYYIKALSESGFVVEALEEMTSDKESVGRQSRMENRSRNDIPLFLALKARKASV